MAQITVTDQVQQLVLNDISGHQPLFSIQNLDTAVPIYFSRDPQLTATPGPHGGFRLDPNGIPWDFDKDSFGIYGPGVVFFVCAAGQNAVMAYAAF